MRDKTELIQELKKDAKSAKTVYLATDPDREGEAISWHLKELLELPDSKARRVTFNEGNIDFFLEDDELMSVIIGK